MDQDLEYPSIIDRDYLPFSKQQLAEHFAPTGAKGGDPDRHLAYYLASANTKADFESNPPVGASALVAQATRRGLQMQKDERFWVVAALMKLFHAPDRRAVLTKLLTQCLGASPPFESVASWEQALGDEQYLYFEANLPSPPAYREWLAQYLNERMLPIPYVRKRAAKAALRLEGATKVDAILIAPDTGFAVLFEAKVLSDISGGVEFDVLRNQIARNIDVMLDTNPRLAPPLNKRDPTRTCFVLLTPDLFRESKESRLYGWLLDAYQKDDALLARHLPHRSPKDLATVGARLGWLTWEECDAVLAGSCPWLSAAVEDRP